MIKDQTVRRYSLAETPTFRRSAGKFYVADELMTLFSRLSMSPYDGERTSKDAESILIMRYPDGESTSKGFQPIVLYYVDVVDSRVILIDAVEDRSSLIRWLDDEENHDLIVRYSRLFFRIVYGVFGGEL